MSIVSYAGVAVIVFCLLVTLSSNIAFVLRGLAGIAVLAICAFFYAIGLANLQPMGPFDFVNSSPWKETIVLALIIAGILAHHFWRKYRNPNASQEREAPIVYAFALAAMMFGSVLTQIGDQAMSWFVALFAFQNGFFMRALMSKN